MNSKMLTIKKGEHFNSQFDYLTVNEKWVGKFPITRPGDCIDMFKKADYAGEGMKSIQRTSAAKHGSVAHHVSDLEASQYEQMPFHGFRMFVQQCCGRMDEHFCGALHPIKTNINIEESNLATRPQISSTRNIFIPCGVKTVKFVIDGIPNCLLGTKFRKCMCGKPVMVTGAVVRANLKKNFISFCSDDYLQVIVNPIREGKCRICSMPLPTYEATQSWKNCNHEVEYIMANNLCYRCTPVATIFSLMMSNGHSPVVNKKTYEQNRYEWKKTHKMRHTTRFPEAAIMCANHEEIQRIIESYTLTTDIQIIEALNRAWVRDLTRENVESNPGPANYIQKLNELCQKEAICQPIYDFEMIVVNNQLAFRCTCYFREFSAIAEGPSKKTAKHLTAAKIWSLLNNC
uniref:Nonstructural protein 1 n=1 Tax=Porcine rotavirus H TaxID=1420855 RepID=A0A3G9DK13_9REOV|nr:Nonstructural protein 1 [Porcine rotavirus H]